MEIVDDVEGWSRPSAHLTGSATAESAEGARGPVDFTGGVRYAAEIRTFAGSGWGIR